MQPQPSCRMAPDVFESVRCGGRWCVPSIYSPLSGSLCCDLPVVHVLIPMVCSQALKIGREKRSGGYVPPISAFFESDVVVLAHHRDGYSA